jgi:hypothetical protein
LIVKVLIYDLVLPHANAKLAVSEKQLQEVYTALRVKPYRRLLKIVLQVENVNNEDYIDLVLKNQV